MQVSAMERITGTANSLRPARPISAVTVAMEPGPARRGMARGKIATSSCSKPSCVSSGVTRVRCGCARNVSIEVSSSRTPPATLNAPRVTPNTLKISVPATAKVVRTKKAVIDARSAAHTILKVEEATYRELVENASDVIYAHDLEGRFTWVNRACERITGYTRDETLRLRIWDLVAPEYRAAMEKNLSAEMQTFEVEVVAKDGRRIPLELKSRLVYRGHMPIGVQGIARDISERKRAAEAMRESEERYALAALGSNDGLWG